MNPKLKAALDELLHWFLWLVILAASLVLGYGIVKLFT
jgi:hypothetical protein